VKRNANYFSPGYLTMALGVGHAVWGSIAYRDGLREIARAGFVDSVGDGLFRAEHSQDKRAAAFWFMAVTPLAVLIGYLDEAAIRAEDRRAVMAAGAGTALFSAAGMAAIPRSGFPAGLALGAWLLDRARRMGATA